MSAIQIENNEAIMLPGFFHTLDKRGQTHRVIIVDEKLQRHELLSCSQYVAHLTANRYNANARRRHGKDKGAHAYVQRLAGLGCFT